MRITNDPKDYAYNKEDLAGILVVLDGEVCTKVLTADDREGFVERFVSNSQNGLVVCHCGNRLMTELCFGIVQIIKQNRLH